MQTRQEKIQELKDGLQLAIHGDISRFSLHVHDDIEEGVKWFKIPLALWDRECVYIMQEDRCVFVGNRKNARSFYEKNDGEYCRSRFPL